MEGNINNEKSSDGIGCSEFLRDILRLDEDCINATTRSSVPSLEHMATVSFVITSWNHVDVRDHIVSHMTYRHSGLWSDEQVCLSKPKRAKGRKGLKPIYNKQAHWEMIESIVLDVVSGLPLPRCILNELINAVIPIGQTLLEWLEYQVYQVFYALKVRRSTAVSYLDDLVWTPRGRIDYATTAKVLLSKDELSDDAKYRIACTYCLEDDVVAIAPKVLHAGYLQHLNRGRGYVDSRSMTSFWTRRLTKAPFIPRTVWRTPEVEIFYTVCRSSTMNSVAIKYLWHQLSSEEKKDHFEGAIEQLGDLDLMIFFLSQATAEQREQMLSKYWLFIVREFMTDWLWKDFFLPTICLMWNAMSAYSYCLILMTLGHGVALSSHNGNRFVNTQDKLMLKGLWARAPEHLKQHAFENDKGDSLAQMLSAIFCRETVDVVQLILSSASVQQKKQIIHSECCIERCTFFITTGQWELLEMLVACTLSCKVDVDNFKKRVAELNGYAIYIRFVHENERDKLKQFIEWCFDSSEGKEEFMRRMMAFET